MKYLLQEVRQCTFCEPHLPLGANPIVSGNENSKIILISQAPGRVVHESRESHGKTKAVKNCENG